MMTYTEFKKLEAVLGHPPRQHEVLKAIEEKTKLLQICPN